MCTGVLALLLVTQIHHSRPIILLHRWAEFVRLVSHGCSLDHMPIVSERLSIICQCKFLGGLGRNVRKLTLLPQAHAMQRVLCHLLYWQFNQDW